MSTSGLRLRPARPGDEGVILAMIRALAVYEREPDAVRTTEADLTAALFPAHGEPAVFVTLAETADDGETPRSAGLALWFLSFSTWEGRHGIYLEDLFVLPEHRGRGIGRALLAHLASLCLERGYRRLEWSVLDWNEPALGFYRSLGAVGMDEWTTHRLDGSPLRELGGAH